MLGANCKRSSAAAGGCHLHDATQRAGRTFVLQPLAWRRRCQYAIAKMAPELLTAKPAASPRSVSATIRAARTTPATPDLPAASPPEAVICLRPVLSSRAA